MSLLMWECGLKHVLGNVIYTLVVTPYVGVWIETTYHILNDNLQSHSLCGSVD